MMDDININGATETWIKGTSSAPTPSSDIPKFWTKCLCCTVRYRLHRGFLNKPTRCRSCDMEFAARESPVQGLAPGKESFLAITHKRILIQILRELQQQHPVASNCRPSFWTMCRNCDFRYHYLKTYLKKWFVCHKCKDENIATEALARPGEVMFNIHWQKFKSPSKNTEAHVSGKEVSPGLIRAVKVGEKRERNEYGGSYNGDAERGEESVQPKISRCAGLKFNDFGKLREEVNFAVGQTWSLYDTTDGMPRLYAQIRKVSAPFFGLRITYLEPDPDDEKQIQWFEQDLPVSAGKFRLGKSQNTKDRSIFSHVLHCNEGSNTGGHLTVSPRKGETWALFKNWDINWSSEPDSHRKYEYEFVEILSDYADGAGVSVAFLHKAKGFASVFFRLGAGEADISQILPHNIYQFSHRIPSFKMTGFEGKGLPKDAYELDQAALPETIEEKIVPPHLYAEPKPKALCFPSITKGKVFQAGQIWSFYSGNDNLPLHYCRIQKITLTQAFEQEAVFKLHVGRLKATPFPEDDIQWEDKKMPVGCGTFSVRKVNEIHTPDDVSLQIVPQTSTDGNEYTTILPKIGEVWAIYRFWGRYIIVDDLERNYLDYDIVQVLDDDWDYVVFALEAAFFSNEDEKNTVFRRAKSRHPHYDGEDGPDVMFTIPKSKMLRFSHQIPASRVTKEIDGEMRELFEVDTRALPTNVKL